jgi:hypothetical protein
MKELVLPNPIIVSAGATVEFELMTFDNLVLASVGTHVALS